MATIANDPPNHVAVCSVHAFGGFFEAATMPWFYTVVLAEIFAILKKSKKRQRTNPPSYRRIFLQAGAIYLFGIGVGIWGMFACIGSDRLGLEEMGNEQQQQNIFNATFALLILPPLLCVSYIIFQIWKKHLLPRSGKTRALYLYIMRIMVLFFLYAVFVKFLLF